MHCLDRVKAALLTVSDNVGHYEALKQDDDYIVWAEDGGGDQLNADNAMQEQVITGMVHLYTRTENSPLVSAIQNAMKSAKISFSLSAVQYEDSTKYIHYSWDFEVSGVEDRV